MEETSLELSGIYCKTELIYISYSISSCCAIFNDCLDNRQGMIKKRMQ